MKITKTEFKLISSLEKVFFKYPYETPDKLEGSMMKNEIYSFQMTGHAEGKRDLRAYCHIEIESELKDVITMYEIGYVPSLKPVDEFTQDPDYLTKTPGLFPDPMYKLKDGKFVLPIGRAKSIWFAVEPNGKYSGVYPIQIKVYGEEEGLLATFVHTVTILDVELPKQKLMNTGWIHGDCLASLHNTEIGSEAYQEILEKYLTLYCKFGHNMILTPIFTPPLDTDIGKERPTNQLVDVTVANGEYKFGFQRLGQWFDMCLRVGIEYFEMAHLFTQWGAGHAPKIMATVDGEYRRIFGWDTAASGKEYGEFLDAFLPALRSYLEERDLYEKCLFHVSDEPHEEDVEQYTVSRNMVAKHIDEDRLMDATSRYVYYEKGLIKRPVACNNRINPFLDNHAEHLWTYYCCSQVEYVANRFMAMPAYRNRILGYQLYKYNIEGFLHWGFNFWYTLRSRAVINPYHVTDADDAFSSGDAFIVYPLNEDGEIVTSTRLYVFNEGMQDLRALELLESLTDRKTVEALLMQIDRFDRYPRNAAYILDLRETVNQAIQAAIQKGEK